jgi:hypothetical protein
MIVLCILICTFSDKLGRQVIVNCTVLCFCKITLGTAALYLALKAWLFCSLASFSRAAKGNKRKIYQIYKH